MSVYLSIFLYVYIFLYIYISVCLFTDTILIAKLVLSNTDLLGAMYLFILQEHIKNHMTILHFIQLFVCLFINSKAGAIKYSIVRNLFIFYLKRAYPKP